MQVQKHRLIMHLLMPRINAVIQSRKNEQMKQVYINDLEESNQTIYSDDNLGSIGAPVMRRDPFEEAGEDIMAVSKKTACEENKDEYALDNMSNNTESSTGLRLKL